MRRFCRRGGHIIYKPQKPINNIALMAKQLKAARKRMWPSVETACFLYNWANFALIVALVLGAISTVVVVWMGNVKEEYSNLVIEQTREQVAKAEQSAAEANKVAEQERLARIKIEQQLAPRSLSQAQIEGISAAISTFGPIPIDVFVVDSSPEAADLSNKIDVGLLSAGWKPMTWTWTGMGAVSGVLVLFEPGASPQVVSAASGLSGALTAAGLSSGVGQWPGDWAHFAGILNGPEFDVTRAQIRLIVGSKP